MTLDLNFCVPRSEFSIEVDLAIDCATTLIGPSGCGKSTVLRTIAGVESHATGVINVGDQLWLAGSRSLPATLRSVGYLGQRDGLFPHLTSEDNVAFPLRVDGVGRSHRRRQACELLERVGLAEARDRRPHELSGGQRRRVALARSLSAPRAVFLLDEPLAGLDERTALLATDFIADQLSDFDALGIIALHDAARTREFSPRAIRLDRGQVVEDLSVGVAAKRARGSARVRQSIGGRQLDCQEDSR